MQDDQQRALGFEIPVKRGSLEMAGILKSLDDVEGVEFEKAVSRHGRVCRDRYSLLQASASGQPLLQVLLKNDTQCLLGAVQDQEVPLDFVP